MVFLPPRSYNDIISVNRIQMLLSNRKCYTLANQHSWLEHHHHFFNRRYIFIHGGCPITVLVYRSVVASFKKLNKHLLNGSTWKPNKKKIAAPKDLQKASQRSCLRFPATCRSSSSCEKVGFFPKVFLSFHHALSLRKNPPYLVSRFLDALKSLPRRCLWVQTPTDQAFGRRGMLLILKCYRLMSFFTIFPRHLPPSFFFHPEILVVQCILRKRIKDAIRILQLVVPTHLKNMRSRQIGSWNFPKLRDFYKRCLKKYLKPLPRKTAVAVNFHQLKTPKTSNPVALKNDTFLGFPPRIGNPRCNPNNSGLLIGLTTWGAKAKRYYTTRWFVIRDSSWPNLNPRWLEVTKNQPFKWLRFKPYQKGHFLAENCQVHTDCHQTCKKERKKAFISLIRMCG